MLSRIVALGVLGAVVAVLFAMSATFDSDKTKFVDLEPGVYKGAIDETLSSDTREELRQRAGKMRF